MTLKKVITLFHTVRYLKFCQLFWRVVYSCKKLCGNRRFQIIDNPLSSANIKLCNSFIRYKGYYQKDNTFIFLNKSHTFSESIDWNFSENGKLWTYNLNYFNFLFQDEIDLDEGLVLIRDYCTKINKITYGLDPYPTSLRCVNWVKFLLEYQIKDNKIDVVLWSQLRYLRKNVEYHLLGNHVLENLVALLIGSIYFKQDKLYLKIEKLLKKQLNEQILPDGAHFELSPMYHNILLERLLDCINIIQSDKYYGKDLLHFIKEKAELMLGWTQKVSFSNEIIPLFNDAAFGVSSYNSNLFLYGKKNGTFPFSVNLSTSGYRKFCSKEFKYECLLDVGSIGPDYQPGHAHADTFSFELYHMGKPLIVDTGTSTYEPGKRRFFERSTKAHNTVEVLGLNSSEVWASHRVGRRAKVNIVDEKSDYIKAWHTGYKHKGIKHQRTFDFKSEYITIIDEVIGVKSKNGASAFLHFPPNINLEEKNNKIIINKICEIEFIGHNYFTVSKYFYSPEFNKLIPAFCVKINFDKLLKTKFIFKN